MPPTSEVDLDDGQDEQLAALLDSIQQQYHRQTKDATAAPSVPLAAIDDSAADFVGVSLLDEAFTIPREAARGSDHLEAQAPADQGHNNDAPDTRSPLERFRSPPKRFLSVSDFVGPAFCELKYWYSLINFGKQRATPAMKKGRKLHRKLEKQVKVSVKVDVKTKEDFFGIRVWNTIQSLRSLRITGLAREVQVWGIVQGQLIAGVIDQLSYSCPDAALESSSKDQPKELPADQRTISDYFSSSQNSETGAPQSHRLDAQSKVYITDVKTRSVTSLPQKQAFFSTQIQLMLYRTLLIQLATGQVDPARLYERSNLDPNASFSEDLIRQLSTVGEEASDSASSADQTDQTDQEAEPAALETDVDTAAELLGHNNLALLWQLMLKEFRMTFPNGEDSVGSVLAAEYRAVSTGEIIGTRTCLHDPSSLTRYVSDELQWWRGDRPVRGVELNEAWKCRVCDFAPSCEWRIGKDEAQLQKSHTRRESAKGSRPDAT